MSSSQFIAAGVVVVAMVVSLACCTHAGPQVGPPLPQLRINKKTITVSGVSSGAAMAAQLHVSHSASIAGVAMVAGPPFYCAEGNIEVALSSCTKDPALILVDQLVAFTDNAAATLTIDPTHNLRGSRVWLFSGTKDTEVVSGVVEKTRQFYETWVDNSSLAFVNSLPAEHSWVTEDFGNDCGFFGAPYMNHCNYDSAGSLLQHLLGPLKPRSATKAAPPQIYGTHHYVPLPFTPAELSLGQTFAMYVPPQCNATGSTVCHLHVALHGCLQGMEYIGSDFTEHSGLNEWAKANDIVVMYPQAVKSDEIPFNPKGCWDWWGYTGEEYACKLAPQIITISRMIEAVAGSLGQF
eukprot:m.13054 g.13054  ORF g.13054 m.13054 type:complete len:351 (+) comp4442_c0_seq1:4190-5242(+)